MSEKKPTRRVRFFISENFKRLFADILAISPHGRRSQLISEVLRKWDGNTRRFDMRWRGPIELRITLEPDVYDMMRRLEAGGTSRHELVMQAFAHHLEQRERMDSPTLDDGDNDDLTPERLEYLRKQLTAMRARLVEIIRSLRDLGSTREVGDEADLASTYQDMVERCSMIERSQAQLREVEAALERMKQGEYGYCEKTGDPIGWRRLKANPVARLSIHAQEYYERFDRVGA